VPEQDKSNKSIVFVHSSRLSSMADEIKNPKNEEH